MSESGGQEFHKPHRSVQKKELSEELGQIERAKLELAMRELEIDMAIEAEFKKYFF